MGLVEESDIEKYRKKLGIKKGIDLTQVDLEDMENLLKRDPNAPVGSVGNPRKKQTRLQKAKKEFEKEEFKKIIVNYKQEQEKVELMGEDEKEKYKEERSKLKEVFRGDEVKYFPLIIKASTAGTLETLLTETDKQLRGLYRLSVIDYAVGPITEGDLSTASQTGAVILGFDVPCSPMVLRTAFSANVCVRQHRIIYKFLEDVQNYVEDVKKEIAVEQGMAANIDILGSAQIGQVFKVKDTTNSKTKGKMIPVAGSRVLTGELEKRFKYRVLRGEKVLQDNLKMSGMKKL